MDRNGMVRIHLKTGETVESKWQPIKEAEYETMLAYCKENFDGEHIGQMNFETRTGWALVPFDAILYFEWVENLKA